MEVIRSIINEWDPLDLFPAAPADEYSAEIKHIYDNIKNCRMSDQSLGEMIYRVFCESFDETLFMHTLQECIDIARRINARLNP